jgi:hypothetical protein
MIPISIDSVPARDLTDTGSCCCLISGTRSKDTFQNEKPTSEFISSHRASEDFNS